MKILFFLLFCSKVSASTPIMIFHEGAAQEVKGIQALLTQEYQIPVELIGIELVEDCEKLRSKSPLGLCLKNNGDLEAVSVDRGFINESLKIFKAP